ncbi:MAG: sugar nucleotide-binding protein [Acidobacteriota bacterium]|nr:sugar nucleotide-binding protein [Acidobacteriota bacterium]
MKLTDHGSMSGVELWGGFECTVNRVGNTWFNQLERNGHLSRIGDLELVATLGIRTLRYPVLWELIAPESPACMNWGWAQLRLDRLRMLGITPILGLLHHGSGPSYTSLVDPGFAVGLAQYAGQVAARFPWVQWYTPVNEPLTTARFSGLYGIWYPHGRDDRTFARTLVNQCRGTILAMRAIRCVNPAAKLLQTDDLGTTYGTTKLSYQANFDNERRWLGWDLLCGSVNPAHPMRDYLLASGISAGELDWFCENACPPDLVGINHYVTSDRYLDENVSCYPEQFWGRNGREQYADVEAVRVAGTPTDSWRPILHAAWARYRLPLAVTEVHLGCTREEQLRWLCDAWMATQDARAAGVDVRAVTAWALNGTFGWDTLLTATGCYESGAFDVRAPTPHPTALARLIRDLIDAGAPRELVLGSPGWWARPERVLYPRPASLAPSDKRAKASNRQPRARPILICDGGGPLAVAFAHAAAARALQYEACTLADLDVCDSTAIEKVMDALRPWCVINAPAGFAGADEMRLADVCRYCETREPQPLVAAVHRHGLQLLTLSPAPEFDGSMIPHITGGSLRPIRSCECSKVAAEAGMLLKHPDALCRTRAAVFALAKSRHVLADEQFTIVGDHAILALEHMIVTPTSLPDLVNACLDLLIDAWQAPCAVASWCANRRVDERDRRPAGLPLS